MVAGWQTAAVLVVCAAACGAAGGCAVSDPAPAKMSANPSAHGTRDAAEPLRLTIITPHFIIRIGRFERALVAQRRKCVFAIQVAAASQMRRRPRRGKNVFATVFGAVFFLKIQFALALCAVLKMGNCAMFARHLDTGGC